MYWPYHELLAGFTALHNEPFMRRMLLEPWLACALHPRCMCTVDPHATRYCPHTQRQVGGGGWGGVEFIDLLID
jgi:hypothetical protein